jgi:hypothetical protein
MRQALHAEWTKLRTTPGPGWLLLTAIALTVAVSTVAAAAVRCPAACQVDAAKLSLTGIDLGQAVVAIVAVLVISGEYSTGMIHITLAAMPRRSTMLAAKATIVTGAVTDPDWHRHLQQIGPMSAGLAIQATTGLRSLPISPWAGLGVLAAWAAAALLAGGLLLRRRDA